MEAVIEKWKYTTNIVKPALFNGWNTVNTAETPSQSINHWVKQTYKIVKIGMISQVNHRWNTNQFYFVFTRE